MITGYPMGGMVNNGMGMPPYDVNMMGYQERMAQLQNQLLQSRQQINGLNGKIVDSVEVFRATDIPMDGNTYYFPKADGTEIYAKKWLPNGTTATSVYTLSNSPSDAQNSVTEPLKRDDLNVMNDNIMNMLNSINERMENLEKSIARPINSKARKEETA